MKKVLIGLTVMMFLLMVGGCFNSEYVRLTEPTAVEENAADLGESVGETKIVVADIDTTAITTTATSDLTNVVSTQSGTDVTDALTTITSSTSSEAEKQVAVTKVVETVSDSVIDSSGKVVATKVLTPEAATVVNNLVETYEKANLVMETTTSEGTTLKVDLSSKSTDSTDTIVKNISDLKYAGVDTTQIEKSIKVVATLKAQVLATSMISALADDVVLSPTRATSLEDHTENTKYYVLDLDDSTEEDEDVRGEDFFYIIKAPTTTEYVTINGKWNAKAFTVAQLEEPAKLGKVLKGLGVTGNLSEYLPLASALVEEVDGVDRAVRDLSAKRATDDDDETIYEEIMKWLKVITNY